MKTDIPFFTFNAAPESLKEEWSNAASEVINSGKFILGPKVKEFEEAWSNRLNIKGSVSVGNGLDGLSIALVALGIKKGDHVAVPAHTFIACWFAIHQVGGIAVGVDVDQDGLIDLEELFNLREIPRFVMPVHMHGKMVDMIKLMRWAQKNGVRVVEDSSQSHGAILAGKASGTWGDIGVFSLYPTKNLGALGDAGVLVADDIRILQLVRQLANYGAQREDKYRHELIGTNSRLDELQAAFLLVSLKYFDLWIERRKEIGTMYENQLKKCTKISVLQSSGDNNSRHHFVLRANSRDALVKELNLRGVSTEIHYPKLAAHEYQKINSIKKVNYPKAESLSNEILSLPISQWQTDSEVLLISKIVREIEEDLD